MWCAFPYILQCDVHFIYRDAELWAEVLQETNEYRRQLIDQVGDR